MSTSHALSKHPKELWILALTELCERFAFWGIGNLLVLYAIEYYHLPNAQSTQIYGAFSGFAAFSPLVGGWIADRWNYRSPMLLGALLNAIGCFMIASGIELIFYPSLFLIACGYGIFTPSIITVLGFTYRNHPHLRESGFSIYYASINIGVFLALASLGTIAKLYSWRLAFSVAGIVQLVGLIPLIWYLVQHKESHHAFESFQKESRSKKKAFSKEDKDRLKVIAAFCGISILFWMAYNQAFSSVEIFIHSFMNRTIGNVEIPEGIFLSSESFFLILLAPILSVLYAYLQKKKKDPAPTEKTCISLFFMAASFTLMVIACLSIPDGATSAQVPYAYVIGSFFLMAVGEMLLAPIGLSMISALSPPRLTALMIGFWYVCVGVAFFSGGMLASLMNSMKSLSSFFSIFAIMMLIPALILLFYTKKLTKMSHFHLQKAKRPSHIER